MREATADWALPVHIATGEANRYDAFAACDAALAASGTVALELAMARVPYTIAYQTSRFTAWLIRKLVTGKYANLVNILADREIVKEYLLEKCVAENLTSEVEKLLDDDEYRHAQLRDASEILKQLGADDPIPPSQKAARVVLEMAKKG